MSESERHTWSVPRVIWVPGVILVTLAAMILIAASFAFVVLRQDMADLKRESESLRGVVANHRGVREIYLKTLILEPKLDPALAYRIATIIHREAPAFKRDPDLVLAIISHESIRFDPKSTSPVGAIGLMQVMPNWREILGNPNEDLTDPEINITRGLQILGSYEHHFKDLRKALTAYNRGAGPVESGIHWNQSSDNGYADKVLTTYEWLKSIDRAVGDQQ